MHLCPPTILALLSATSLVLACGPSGPRDPGDGVTIDSGTTPTTDATPGQADAARSGFDDFPADPIIDPSAPPNAPDLFDAAGSTDVPCLLEPEDGALFPRHWLRARFRVAAPAGHNLFEYRLRAPSQTNDLVAYAATDTWVIPASIWQGLNEHTVDEAIAIEIRSARYNGFDLDAPPAGGPVGSFTIAPVGANGSVVYWTSGTSGSVAALKGFEVGDETVQQLMTPADAGVGCVGCHNSTPDGDFVGFSANVAVTDGRPAHADVRRLDGTAAQPDFLTDAARALLGRSYQQQPVFSAAHWDRGDRVAVTTFETGGATELIWTDLETTSEVEGVGWGVLSRTGHAGSAAAPVWSHDGAQIAYVGSSFVSSGMNLDNGGGDIFAIPYGDRAGGTATPIAGASEASVSEHYPAFSADDSLLAFTRVPVAQSSYHNAQSEVYVVPAAGGTPVRLAANDPPACSGRTSPGAGNSWPKWSPRVEADGSGVKYYWLTFSSRREATGLPQLYVAAITVDELTVTTYPALYLWNQPANEHNHTPAWDDFDIVVD